MKITIITSPFGLIPPNGYGAIERRWYQMAREMVKLGHELTLISKKPIPNEQKESDNVNLKVIYLKGYKRTGSLFKDLFFDFIYSWNALKLAKKQDVLIMNTFWSPFLYFFNQKKSIVSVYNVARFPKGQFKFLRFIDRLSCVSKSVYNELMRQAPQLKKQIRIINNPINTEVFFYHPKTILNTKLDIIYTGRIHPEKGLEILVEAWNNLKQKYSYIQLTLMGPHRIEDGGGGGIYVKKLNKFASPYLINWIEPVSDPKLLNDRLINSDIYCYPSVAEKGETFGVAPLEAMATGTATIVSALECFQDFVIDGKNGFVFNHRAKVPVQQLISKLELLIKDENLRNNFAKEGAKTALNFSNKNITEQYLNDFEELINEKLNAGIKI